MNVRDQALLAELCDQLVQFNKDICPLPGISSTIGREVFVGQLIDSIRRVKYIYTIGENDVSQSSSDPTSNYFDPLKAAILFKRKGLVDEAFWLVFLFTHFGKAKDTGWRLVRDIYGGLGEGNIWTWDRMSQNPEKFNEWLQKNYCRLKGDGIPRKFGNHRKYETLNPNSKNGTGQVIDSYVNWVGPLKSHVSLFEKADEVSGFKPRETFDFLYKSMNKVHRFGRTAKFDYLCMVGKLGLTSIEPGSTYMKNSTGPSKGARLLFGDHVNASIGCAELEEKLINLEDTLSLGKMGMQILEDALCNWQKSPKYYKRFKG